MKKRRNSLRGITAIVLTLVFMLVNAATAFAADTAYSQIDTAAVPYQVAPNTYLISQDAVLTWKKYNTILGYNDAGTVKNAEPTVEIYENRQGDTPEGTLCFAWTFDGSVLQPILESKKGPISLGITLKEAEGGLTVAFATTRVFDGKITIKLNVDSYFAEGDKLLLSYVDGVDSSQIHGTDTSTAEVVLPAEADLEVQDGFVEFAISNGGNYTLVKVAREEEDTESDVTASEETEPGVVDNETGTEEADMITGEAGEKEPGQEMDEKANADISLTADEAALTVVTEAPETGEEEAGELYGIMVLMAGIGLLALKRRSNSRNAG
jgi:hypothetical protein